MPRKPAAAAAETTGFEGTPFGQIASVLGTDKAAANLTGQTAKALLVGATVDQLTLLMGMVDPGTEAATAIAVQFAETISGVSTTPVTVVPPGMTGQELQAVRQGQPVVPPVAVDTMPALPMVPTGSILRAKPQVEQVEPGGWVIEIDHTSKRKASDKRPPAVYDLIHCRQGDRFVSLTPGKVATVTDNPSLAIGLAKLREIGRY